MNTKLLRKIRKRFSWKPVASDHLRYGPQLIIDHKEHTVTEVLGFNAVIEEVMYLSVGFFTYRDWRNTRFKRAQRAEYLRTLKPAPEL